MELFKKSSSSDRQSLKTNSFFNAGNAHFQLHEYDEAIDMYEKVLNEIPEDDDAKFNLEFVREQIKNKNIIFFALYGRWEALGSIKMMARSMRSFSDIGGFILRSLFFLTFFCGVRPTEQKGKIHPKMGKHPNI